MHEQSLVNSLLRQAEEIRLRHCAEAVTEIRIEIGPLSGVEPCLLASAFEMQAAEKHFASAQLVIEEVSLQARCEACDFQFEVDDFDFRCSRCGGNSRVTHGEGVELISVSLKKREPKGKCSA